MQKLLIATHNPGKIREYQALLADLPLSVTSLATEGITLDVEETGATFTENALLKARAYAKMSGLLTWADDSGLEVDALNGRPGVYSARYGGPGATDQDRYQTLIRELQELEQPNKAPLSRRARFRCVVALCMADGRTFTTEGVVEGEIIDTPRGEHGFGYDPVFWMADQGATMAELPPALKNRLSHRGQAAQAAQTLLRKLLEG